MSPVQEALTQFRAGPGALDAAVAGATPDELSFSPAAGKWNIRQIVRHVADTEIVAGMRLRHIAAEDRPTLIPFDQDAWATNLDYAAASPADSLVTFRTLRNDTARLLESLPVAAFDRTGIHPERGERSLLAFVELFGRH
ncbi:MAG TPA: DinB family protein, partial [Bryobacteraceae bacterium]|nr:DinB family protein [Bryobacteraceae bacterium]